MRMEPLLVPKAWTRKADTLAESPCFYHRGGDAGRSRHPLSAHRLEAQIADLVTGSIGEPQPIREPRGRLPVAPGREPYAARAGADRKFDDRPVRHHAAQRRALGVPDIAVGADGDVGRRAARARDLKLRDLAFGRDASDAVAVGLLPVCAARELDEPKIAVDTGGDVARAGARSRQCELGDRAGRRDAADLA